METIITHQAETLATGHVQWRKTTAYIHDGRVIGQEHHRRVLAPGDALDDVPDEIVSVARAWWTPAMIDIHKRLAEEAARMRPAPGHA
jgi:hypothetical protein